MDREVKQINLLFGFDCSKSHPHPSQRTYKHKHLYGLHQPTSRSPLLRWQMPCMVFPCLRPDILNSLT